MYKISYLVIFSIFIYSFSAFAQLNNSAERTLPVKPKVTTKNNDKLSTAKKTKVKKSIGGLTVSSKKSSRPQTQDSDKMAKHEVKRKNTWISIRDFFCKSCRESKTDCPDKVDRKVTPYEVTNYNTNATPASRANIIRSTNSVHFDVVQLADIHLDIPAFKQFKNNMTDFTADGETEFHEIIHKIGVYLGTNYEGKGVTLKIIGSASQIPTSFDPDKPNNNINPNGSSIIGKTSVEHNRRLAKARADELAKKIIAVFPSIQIITPNLNEIQLGPTKWTKECQIRLGEAFRKKDKAATQAVYEPFQKDQWVKVESKEKTSKSIQPESIRMFMVSTTPFLKATVNGEDVQVKSVCIVSKRIYELIEENKAFATVEERDKFIEELNLQVFYEIKNGVTRWYLLSGLEEISAFNTKDYNDKVFKLYQLGIVDNQDEQILEQMIISDLSRAQY